MQGRFTRGNGRSGRLGLGDLRCDHVPRPTPLMKSKSELLSFAHIACGNAHSVGVTADGSVYCWGCNVHGELGRGEEKTQQLMPMRWCLQLSRHLAESASSSSCRRHIYCGPHQRRPRVHVG